ncbi:uncharacterized protein MELLADRAFT_72331 [Melampsora larici-populina 98AG31]|uniref:Uncharacterized protein n=1 Tax=Melampsora larici-populina (strain 98AG31 / pathotype 3-4-7) TaxID=747676 RepID=F4RSH3_MELLP|nr:uncharacterized protein MELLADRAFT_72331 [Melampsora larici-populina 98AG31]EGG04600.1 hypothetical protein MELLADRAFT_72331 [Melampsora larici-populina 98AG31]
MSVTNSELKIALQSLRTPSPNISNPSTLLVPFNHHHPHHHPGLDSSERLPNEVHHRLSTPSHSHSHQRGLEDCRFLVEPILAARPMRLSAPPCNT